MILILFFLFQLPGCSKTKTTSLKNEDNSTEIYIVNENIIQNVK